MTVEQITEARTIVDVVSVQNEYNLTNRSDEDVLDYCERHGLAFLPWLPIASGRHARSGGPLAEVAEELGATPVQVALAWLLRRSPVMLPIPGTRSVPHLEENLAAARVRLSHEQFQRLATVA